METVIFQGDASEVESEMNKYIPQNVAKVISVTSSTIRLPETERTVAQTQLTVVLVYTKKKEVGDLETTWT
jgi:hypothetical protein